MPNLIGAWQLPRYAVQLRAMHAIEEVSGRSVLAFRPEYAPEYGTEIRERTWFGSGGEYIKGRLSPGFYFRGQYLVS